MNTPFYQQSGVGASAEGIPGSVELATNAEVITGTNTTKAVTPAGLAAKIGDINALIYKGVIDCSTNPNYPAAEAGHVYIVSVAGKIGGASGTVVAAGDLLLCKVDSSAAGTEAAVGANWDVLEKNIDLTNIIISGGSINGTPIGGTTPAAGKFTSLATTENVVDTTLSGIPKIFTLYDGATPYYVKAYPTKV